MLFQKSPNTKTAFLLVIVGVICSAFATDTQEQSQIQCSPETISVLEELFFSTDGPQWKCGSPGRPCPQVKGLVSETGGTPMAATWAVGLSTPWKDSSGKVKPSIPSCCTWYGVACGSEGEVTSLVLSANSLTGPIPNEIVALTALQHLDLSINNLTGPIPPEIGLLESLTVLNLFDNKLEGAIPESVNLLQKLEKLIMSGNQLEGEIPPAFGLLSELRMLLLNENKLEGTIPYQLGNLTKLTHLYLHNNRLHGTIPPEISDPNSDDDRGPAYLFVNGNQQPHRISFHASEDEKHFVPRSTVKYETFLSEATHLDRSSAPDVEETPAERRERYKRLLAHKQRLMEKTAQRVKTDVQHEEL
mmetsp:Transcript_6653/g.15461  ORF Transcript_6653/g.15461 Transcript_6653/m.15461 type:complete len:360 (+) Transcript_6653:140-1219(+)